MQMEKQRPLARLAARLEIPPEVAVGALRLAITGREELLAVNHCGVAIYRPELIVFRYRGGELAVHGRELCFRELNSGRLKIVGRIARLDWLPAPEATPHA